MIKTTITFTAAILAAGALAGCESDPSDCDNTACDLACVRAGSASGACSGGFCECFGGAADADADSGADTGADADANVDGDAPIDGEVEQDAEDETSDADAACTPRNYQQCGNDGNVHWYDSCGVEGEIHEQCQCGLCTNGSEAYADCDVSAGIWCDEETGLFWEDPPLSGGPWSDGITYCDGLTLGGYEDWRLPTIGELRSFARGCGDTETGGSCGATDVCLATVCYNTGNCSGCSAREGPGAGGCYWDGMTHSTRGFCAYPYLSSSTVSDDNTRAWCIQFASAAVTAVLKTEYMAVYRCVRDGD